jgi:hypothetical protein
MKTLVFFLFVGTWSCSHGQRFQCNQDVRFSSLKNKLDSSICVPKGYIITRIDNKWDLNNDSLKDKVVSWQKVKLSDGDTIFYSIYTSGKDGTVHHYKTLGNLEPLFFTNYSTHSGNKLYDSLKVLYSYPTLSEVEFMTNTISILFYTEATTVKKLFFTYSLSQKTWVLTREIQWFTPSQLADERKKEKDSAPEVAIKIDEFDLLKYIGW